MSIQRFGFVVTLLEDKVEEYEQVHQAVWPEVEQRFKDVGINELVLFRHQLQVFMYLKYEGAEPVEQLLSRYADDPKIRAWEELNAKCKQPAVEATPNGFLALEPLYVFSDPEA